MSQHPSSAAFEPNAGRLWVIGATLAALLFVRDFSLFSNGLIEGQTVWGRDFVNVWTGGLLLNGGLSDPLFDLEAYQRYQAGLFGSLSPHNYSYPPLSYPIAQVMGLFPYPLALALWTAGTGALFVYAARPLWPVAAGPAWLALLTPAALINIWAGHYGFLVGALFLFGWRNLDERPVRAGIFFGLMLIKPHLAILIPLALAVRRDWMAIGSAALTVAMAIIATGTIYGFDGWLAYFLRTSAVQAGMIDAGGAFYGHFSTSFLTAALNVSNSWYAGLLGQFILALAGAGAVIWAVARRLPASQLAMLTATATFLVLPYAFAYDLTVVAVAAVTIIAHPLAGIGARHWAAVGLAAPSFGILLAMFDLPVLSLLLAAQLAAQLALAGAFNRGRGDQAAAVSARSA